MSRTIVGFAILALLAVSVTHFSGSFARADLVSYWTFDNTYDDTGTQGYTGTVSGDPTFSATTPVGHSSGSLSLDGAGDYYTITDTGATSFYHGVFTNSFAVSLWMRSNVAPAGLASDQAFTVDYGASHGDGVGILMNKSHSNFNANAIGSYVGSTKQNGPTGDTNWKFVTVTVSEGTSGTSDINLYVDGVIQDHSTQNYGSLTQNALVIGGQAKSADRHWDGLIDDAAVWDQYLNPREIQLMASGAMSPTEVAALTSWDFRRDMIDGGSTAEGPVVDGGQWSYRMVDIAANGDVTATGPGDFGVLDNYNAGTWNSTSAGSNPSVRLTDFTVHPDGEDAPVIAWTADFEGQVEYFYGLVENNNNAVASPGVQLLFWDDSEGLLTLLEKQDLFPDDPSTVNDHTTLLGVIDVASGDTLYLAIDDGGNGSSNDRVRVDAFIRVVPEPSAFLLAAPGMLSLGFVVVRRRRK